MTYVRYLVLGGFKSLRDWNLLEFSPRVTVLMGGNGTGKSSLVEALLWGLGEEDLNALRVSRPEDLVFCTPRSQREIFQEMLYQRQGDGGGEDDEAVEKAVVYLVMDEPSADDGVTGSGDSCCCKPRQIAGGEVPAGQVTVHRSVRVDGHGAWELDGEPATRDAVQDRLRVFGLDRDSVAVIRQGDLERLLAADEPLRAAILADTAGIPGVGTALMEAALGRDGLRELKSRAVAAAVQRFSADSPDAERTRRLLAALGLPHDGASPADGTAESLEVLLAELEAREEQAAGVDGAGNGRRSGGLGAPSADEPSGALADAVARVDARFGRYFAGLVPGGEAGVELVHHSLSGAAGEVRHMPGVAVDVRFPGQPPVPLDALSGGQRSLVSFALGLAVFEEGPARLLVLDEVEPALDESNLRRFNDLLHEVARDRQVVLVSHQRRTREVGDVVFGVDHLTEGAAGLLFRFEPSTRRLLVFGRARGNWLERAEQLEQEERRGQASLTGGPRGGLER